MGNNGSFDALVYNVLCELRKIYPHICISVVLAYMPTNDHVNNYGSDTILPEGIEAAPKRFAISWRNKWMVTKASHVVTYVTHSWGGAAQFADMAERKGKRVIKIADLLK